ncbi:MULTISPECIES: MGH1-like glycoside hydrolase domain-containing protein [Nostoc]|uniref:Glucosidase n=1 Tax=Nostoc paludosum FACHB-159 TaxID=2692908 RepID=A0ABR8JZT3_9NOSO|nr:MULTISPECIES: glucosidase [Nostoc]MBD2676129.1 glucosidase [Nostoc sp. FACHB-857]MBD2732741.1 glucosidase [Nostoc paludosum FACHB-159]
MTTQEEIRLAEALDRTVHWRRWGPYLSDRQWGTVREDYSHNGTAWDYFTHEQARSRAYRWGEDGIAGISDNHQRLCFAIALWNGEDSILKERIFGLTGNEGNHGEDVKEYYFYLDNTPTHSYMKMLYKYPQTAFPYSQLVTENQRRSRQELEFELLDTGVFDDDRYFDVFVEYAKHSAEDILIQVKVVNRGVEAKTLNLLPTLWFRNTWSWNGDDNKPILKEVKLNDTCNTIEASHPTLGMRWLYCQEATEILFTENETNYQKLFGYSNASAYVKDGINDYIVEGLKEAVNPEKIGTKAAANYILKIGAGETKIVKLRLSDTPNLVEPLGKDFDVIFGKRQHEADEFYQRIAPHSLSEDMRNVQRQAFAGMLWSKQFYHYIVEDWLKGDRNAPPPPPERQNGRNQEWFHLYNEDILSMPDKWEYPWYAAWDLAFHTIPLAMIDPEFAKYQLDVLTREWYMHPNGQIPAYEWKFSDVNPPVHAWATLRIYQIEQKIYGRTDRQFLERVFQKLMLNFTWWVNRKDTKGNNVFQGGFLGLDNIGVFDRSAELPTGGHIDQSDGTSWMGMYCLNMLAIALELAKTNPVYEDIATKFFEHFLYIADAMNKIGEMEASLWNESDGFYYDVLHLNDQQITLKVRSIVGLIPLFAIETIEPETLKMLPGFKKRLEWFIRNRPDLRQNVACMETKGIGARRLLAIVSRDKLRSILQKMLDESEFFSPYGIRALSRFHAEHPYIFDVNGCQFRVDYEPAESSSGLFGGNSNWRGPIWFPVNFLLIESLQKFHSYLGDDFKLECPTGSGNIMTLGEIASELSQRLTRIFLKDSSGKRPVYGATQKFQNDSHWQDLILFYEYFHGDNGAGIGASHQTGWTGLVAKLIQECGEHKTQYYKPKNDEDKKAIALA